MDIIAFEQVLTSRVFRIPDYQRGYSWTKKELEELWLDLANTHRQDKDFHFTGILTVTDFSDFDFQSIRKEGFLVRNGLLWVEDKSFKGVNIVDGQQRLTTLLILLSQLILALEEGEYKENLIQKYLKIHAKDNNYYIFGYHVDVPSHNYLIREIFDDKQYNKEEVETLYTHNLSTAKKYFLDQISGFGQGEIVFWIDKITKQLLFSILNLSESAAGKIDVSMVFETLNFRGKQLSSLERLKNRVLYILSKHLDASARVQRSRKKVNMAWLEVYKWLGRHPQQPLDDDAFLKAFWLLYFSKSTMVSTDFKTYQKRLFSFDFQLDTSYDSQSEDHIEYQALILWLDAMQKAVVLWYFINNPFWIDQDKEFEFIYTYKIQCSLERLNNFPKGYGKYVLNLILGILMRDLPDKNHTLSPVELKQTLESIEQLLWALERHNIMCFLLQGNNSNLNLEDTFRDINFYYHRKRAHSNEYLLDVLLTSRVDHFRYRDVIKHIQKGSRFMSWAGLEYFLKTIEANKGGFLGNGEPKVHLIYPKEEYYEQRATYKDLNSMQKANRDRYCFSLGNMLLSYHKYQGSSFEQIQARIRKAIKNKQRVSKMELELLEYTTWDKQAIEQRGKQMLVDFIALWQLPYIQETEIKRLLLDEI